MPISVDSFNHCKGVSIHSIRAKSQGEVVVWADSVSKLHPWPSLGSTTSLLGDGINQNPSTLYCTIPSSHVVPCNENGLQLDSSWIFCSSTQPCDCRLTSWIGFKSRPFTHSPRSFFLFVEKQDAYEFVRSCWLVSRILHGS